MPPSSTIQDASLAVSAYEQLRSMLLSGGIGGGQVIQERRLAERLGLSRTPVREALGRLEGEGLLRRDGRLLFSVSVSVPEVMEILAVRRLLEADAARAAAGQMPPAQIQSIRAAVLGMADPHAVTSDEHWANDDLLHLSIARASGNSLLLRLIRDLRQRTRMFGLRRIPSRFEAGKDEHLAVLDAIEAGNTDMAGARMQLHIDQAREAILTALVGPTR
jgi:DNA-binding GntR family transcriptional regulator